MFALLRDLVRIQSSSYNKAGVDQVARRIEDALGDNRVTCRPVPQEPCGNHLIIQSYPDRGPTGAAVLLVGHMDTVFPPDTAFNSYKEDERHSYGPGVIDMKGGLVVALYALKALDAAGQLSEIPITLICNADEEIGSGSSGALIRDAARKSAFAFVMECGGLDGAVVTGRKGNLSAKIDITGQAGHAAFADQGKSSAILELAHKIIALEALNDPDSGVTVNVGLIKGGIGANTVPAQASARIDMRFLTPADGALLEKRLNDIVAQPCLPGTGSSCRIMSRRPPMPECERNKDLFRYVQSTAADLGQSIRAEFRYGVSDANLIADENIPVIDGLGPIGANDHSADEYMVKSSLLARTTLLACAIPACWRKYTAKHF